MSDQTYIGFGCNCDPKCVCMLCGIKAPDCEGAGCKDCDKIIGHKGCQIKNEAGHCGLL